MNVRTFFNAILSLTVASIVMVAAGAEAQTLEPLSICFSQDKSPASIEISGKTIPLDCIRAKFLPLASNSGYEIVVDLVFDATELPSLIDTMVRNNMPGSSCNDRYRVKSVEVRPEGGQLVVGGFLGYEKWACASWDVPCCSGLDCRMCRQNASTRLFEVSPFYSGQVSASVTSLDECRANPAESAQSLSIKSSGSVSSGLSRDQEFLVGAIGGLIGNLILGPLGEVAGVLIAGDFLKQSNSVGFNTDLTFPFEEDPLAKQGTGKESPISSRDVALCATGAEFIPDAELRKLTAIVHRSGRKPRAVAKRFHSVLKQQKKLAESDATGEVGESVAKGEGWWHIAERHYGDGRYFMALMGANPQIPARQLFPAEAIRIPTLRSIISDPRTVRAGDSLWTIAERVFGDGARWRDLFDPRFTANPDLIFPASPTKKR
jgi:hypothetical protein